MTPDRPRDEQDLERELRAPLEQWAAHEHDEVERAIHGSTSGKIAGMIIEPVQGYGGIVPMPEGYISGAFERLMGRQPVAQRRGRRSRVSSRRCVVAPAPADPPRSGPPRVDRPERPGRRVG